MRDEDLAAFKRRHLGHGYAERVPGTGTLLDTEYGVPVDVQELIRSAGLAREVVEGLLPWVREKFLEIWELAQAVDPF